MEINEDQWKLMEINENQSKSMKIKEGHPGVARGFPGTLGVARGSLGPRESSGGSKTASGEDLGPRGVEAHLGSTFLVLGWPPQGSPARLHAPCPSSPTRRTDFRIPGALQGGKGGQTQKLL